MWLDRSRGKNAYEVPKGSGNTLIYIGALWMGGMDVNNQLKIAALRYRIGNDFWAGPLSKTPGTGDISVGKLDYGPAEIDAQDCIKWDQFFITTRSEVELFNAWYECSLDPDCDESTEYPDYQIPESILDWGNATHGDLAKDQDFYLAPYYERPGGNVGYDPINDGDYPWYDLTNQIDCRTSRRVTLYGDYNMWWVFNDKGNIHTETGGDPIGMEIRAQAFAFATNDEVNSMTFYNYELINRSTQTLTNTYFGVYLDSDVGCSFDDYVGCDVQRGLGYCYNGNAIDAIGCGSWTTPIGANPPAIGVDFFEGPYQDNDGIDNPLTTSIPLALSQGGIPYKGLGIGYGDGVIDNERFGMKRFVYYDGQLPQNSFGDPQTAIQYYNYMRGLWRDGTRFVYGASGNISSSGALADVNTDYCFPGDEVGFKWTVLVGKERGSKAWMATTVPMKGSSGRFSVDKCMEFLEENGDKRLLRLLLVQHGGKGKEAVEHLEAGGCKLLHGCRGAFEVGGHEATGATNITGVCQNTFEHALGMVGDSDHLRLIVGRGQLCAAGPHPFDVVVRLGELLAQVTHIDAGDFLTQTVRRLFRAG